MKKIGNVLSLFDGMSCGQIALNEIGIKPKIYYASEIDKHAISQTQLNFPNTIQLGSVVDIDVSKLERIDLLIGGSPCQSFSFAGKRKGMSTKCEIQITKLEQYLELKEHGFEFEGQSYLFWEYMRILTDIRKYNQDVLFLLENVEMGSKWERVLSEAIGIYGVHINSALVSAQNRKRIYWTNIRTRQEGLFGELHSDIPQPVDRGILLKDILESDVDEKYYMSIKGVEGLMRASEKQHKPNLISDYEMKSSCIDTRTGAGTHYADYIVAMCGRTENAVLTPKRTEYGKSIRKDYEAGKIIEQRKNIQQLEPRLDGKTNTITSVQKDNLVLQLNPSKESGGVQPYQQNRVYDPNGISPCLNTDARPHAIVTENYLQLTDNGFDSDNRFFYEDGKHGSVLTKGEVKTGVLTQSRIRRLTPTECARLQTVPDWYIWACNDTQEYRMLGNGWTIDVIAHIFSFL